MTPSGGTRFRQKEKTVQSPQGTPATERILAKYPPSPPPHYPYQHQHLH